MPARLFPPIINPYIPAKLITSVNSGISIPFDMNQFDDPSEITEIHVMITRQSNYMSLLKSEPYPLGIIALAPGDLTITNKSITIPSDKLDGKQLSYNEYYKVQLRFSAVTESSQKGIGKTGATLSNILRNESNLARYSEWSSVGLVRFISPINLVTTANIQGDSRILVDGAVAPQSLETHYLELAAQYIKSSNTEDTVLDQTFKRADDKEYLANWRIVIKDNNNNVVMDSGVQELNYRGDETNELKYACPYYFPQNVSHHVYLTITTCNLYEQTYVYYVNANISDNTWSEQSDVLEYTSVDSVIGKLNITFEHGAGKSSIPSGSTFIIRRGSHEDNFAKWEVIYSKHLTSAVTTPISVDDFTIESGNLYKYNITYIAPNQTSYSITEGPVISVFDHAFLTSKDTQLCVKFNPSISNYKVNVSDNIVTTIGSKYPYINRNGNMYYRTFSLSGTIAYEMDAEHQFATRSSIYGEWINVYGSYFVNRYINQQNDRITQREFREMVMNYFYEDKPKLFRSTPEGNILVRLTDISLTPKQELARMIYDFSCTATEIGDCNIDNYKLYDLHNFN